MSVPAQQRAPVVERLYFPKSDACERAVKSLLKSHVNKAAEPAPEPDGHDETETKGDSANGRIIPEQ